MSSDLLNALRLRSVRHLRCRPTTSDFIFQHRSCYDLESLIWVVVYAMMIHQRNIYAATDSDMFELYKEDLDECWAGHAHTSLFKSHNHMVMVGCSIAFRDSASLWFPDPREAAFFCEAMLLVRRQGEGNYITYEGLCALFRRHINLAQEPQVIDVVSK